MNKEDLEILEKALQWANGYFTSYMEFKDEYVYSQEEIDKMEDDEERNNAQEDRDYEDLLDRATEIIKKYKEGK